MNHIQANIAADAIVGNTQSMSFTSESVVIRLNNGKRLAFRFDVDMAEECIVLLKCGVEYDSQSQIADALLDSSAGEMTKAYFGF